MKKMVFIFFGVITLISTGCSDKKAKKLVLMWDAGYASWVDEDKLLGMFHEQYPDMKAEIQWIAAEGWADYAVKLFTTVAGGNPPDAYHIAIEGVEYLLDKKMISPLNEFLFSNPETAEDYKDFHPKLQEPFVRNGNIYALTWDWNNIVAHINLDLLDQTDLPFPEANWNKESFLEYVLALTGLETGDGERSYGLLIPTTYFKMNDWVFNFGGSFLNKEMNRSRMTTEPVVEMYRFFHDLVYKYNVAPIPTGVDTTDEMFLNNRVGMIFAGRWVVKTYNDAGMRWNVQYSPMIKNNEVVTGMGAFFVSSHTEYKEEAFKLISVLTSQKSERESLSANAIPSRISVMEETFILNNAYPENSRIFSESADRGRPVQAPSQYPQVEFIINRYTNDILLDKNADIEALLKQADVEINEVLSSQ